MTEPAQKPTASVAEPFELLPGAMTVGEAIPDTACEIPTVGSSRIIRLGFPAFLRRIQPTTIPERWGPLCQLVKGAGWFLRCEAKDLAELDAAQIPLRLGFRSPWAPFDSMEVQTADLFEVDCQSASGRWNWPKEMGTPDRVGGLLGALRGAAGFNTPIGLSLPLGNSADLRFCLTSLERPDFLTLVDTADELTLGSLHHIRQARRVCHELGLSDFPLFVDSSVQTAHEFLVCLCLGASVVSLDRALDPILDGSNTAKPSLSSSLLDGLSHKPDGDTALGKLQEWVREFQDSVNAGLRLVGAESLAELSPQCLWAAAPAHSALLAAEVH